MLPSQASRSRLPISNGTCRIRSRGCPRCSEYVRRPAPVLDEEHAQAVGGRGEIVVRIERTEHGVVGHPGVERGRPDAGTSPRRRPPRRRCRCGRAAPVAGSPLHCGESADTVDDVDYDVIVLGLGPGRRRGRRTPRPRRKARARGGAPPGRRRVPVLRLHPLEDDPARRRGARRGPPRRRARRRGDGDPRLRAGREPHPRRGHRRLGRQGRRRPVRGRRRHVRPGGGTAGRADRGRAGAGRGRRGRARGAGRRRGDRHGTGAPADRRAGRSAARRSTGWCGRTARWSRPARRRRPSS